MKTGMLKVAERAKALLVAGEDRDDGGQAQPAHGSATKTMPNVELSPTDPAGLPSEVFDTIMMFLPMEERVQAMLVSRTWLAVVRSELTWRSYYNERWGLQGVAQGFVTSWWTVYAERHVQEKKIEIPPYITRLRNGQTANRSGYELRLRVQILGAKASGKTTFIGKAINACRAVDINDYRPTTEVAWPRELDVVYPGAGRCVLALHDSMGGLSELTNRVAGNMAQLEALIVMFDVTDPSSFAEVKEYFEFVQKHRKNTLEDIPVFLLGSKAELRSSSVYGVNGADARAVARTFSAQYFEVSSAKNRNVKETLEAVFRTHVLKIAGTNVDVKRANVFKLVVLGAGGVGKSAFVIRFISGLFVGEYDPTIEDSYRKGIDVPDAGDMKGPAATTVDILDTAGPEEFSSMVDQYMRCGEGFLIMYSCTSRSSFEEVRMHAERVLRCKDVDSVPMVLVATKADLDNEIQVPHEEGERLAKEIGMGFHVTSALRGENINEPLHDVVRRCHALRLDEEEGGVQRDPSGNCCVS